ncbi:MAG: ABC transporter permease subunit [Verrucomicrobiales bacterium]
MPDPVGKLPGEPVEPPTTGSDGDTAVTQSPEEEAPPATPDAEARADVSKTPSPAMAWLRRWLTLREAPGMAEAALLGVLAIVAALGGWAIITAGPPGSRLVSPYLLPSIGETLKSFPSLWFDRSLSISILWSVGRVLGGFLFAVAIGVPLGVLAGSWPRLNALLKPLSIFGRNIPVAALIPLTLIWFGLGETQKVMFIFLASVAFILFDTTSAVQSVPDRFLDSAYTLGARPRWRRALPWAGFIAALYGLVVGFGPVLTAWLDAPPGAPFTVAPDLAAGKALAIRILVGSALGFLLWLPIFGHQAVGRILLPLALPDIVNSLRLLFGLAFGYIMLAEVINAKHGLGDIINVSQRRGPREHIYLSLIIISLLAFGIDRFILWVQKTSFPHVKNVQT